MLNAVDLLSVTGKRGAPTQKRKREETPRHFLECPFDDKDNAKAMGAKWDAAARKWYVPAGLRTRHPSRRVGT